MAGAAQRLGDLLVAQGHLERDALERIAATVRAPLGRALRAHGLVDGRTLAAALAQQQHREWIDLQEAPPEPGLFRPADLAFYQRWHCIPYRRDPQMLLLATSEPVAALLTAAARHYAMPVDLAIVSPRDLAAYFSSRAATASTRHARVGVRRRFPGLVADRVLFPAQRRGLLLLIAAIAAAVAAAPHTSWVALLVACNLFYLLTLGVKLQLYFQGRTARRGLLRLETQLISAAATLDPHALPTYSILVPLYQESRAVMARLIANLDALDYPREKLDIKLIAESDDTETLAALKSLRPPETMEIVAVPPSRPRTKPKACNVALQRIRGEFLVIYDAEDAPAPDQLKRAVALFAQSDEAVACLQAPLNYYNRAENLLTRLFAIEYSALFRLLLPALERLRLPIPLGGTSNHVRVGVLRAIGGWDAFNVTEDADLGIRLAWLGYRTRVLPSLTLEECPISVRAWMKQRTRWIKGYLQTWLVYTRDLPELRRRLGGPAYYGFQFFVGAPALTFLLAPIFWGIFLVSLTGWLPMHLPPAMLGLCLVSFFGGVASHWLFARAVVADEAWPGMRGAMLVYPLYWLLHSFAAARALWQLMTRPHWWEKTRHGVSKRFKTSEIAG